MEFDLQTFRTILIDIGILITTLVVFYRNQKLDGTLDVVIFSALLLLNALIMFSNPIPDWLSHVANFSLLLAFAYCYSAICKLMMANVIWRKVLPIFAGYLLLVAVSEAADLPMIVRVIFTVVACIYLSLISIQLLVKNKRNITSPSGVYLLTIFGLLTISFMFRLLVFLIPEYIPAMLNQISVMVLSNLFLFLAFGLLLLIFEVINKKLLHLSEKDYLAGVNNRRGFFQAIKTKDNQSFQPYVLAILDVDYFKKINDKYGHSAGDFIIKFIADSLLELCDEHDVISRFGGEEFCLLLNNADHKALERLEDIRQFFECQQVQYHSTEIKFTISIGCVNTRLIFQDIIQKLLVFADISLYEAKNAGRNRVICFDEMASI